MTAPVAVTPHYLASEVAVDIMGRGGSAVDAAIAANAVLGVVLPDTCGIGGDLFALVHSPGDSQPAALNASGRAGSNVSAETLRAAGHVAMPLRHPWTVTVPGCVDGWEALASRFGVIPLADLIEPAVQIAVAGFPASVEFAGSLGRIAGLIGDQPSANPLYPGGTPPGAGDRLTRPLLAETLLGIAAKGRSALYDGPVGEAISDATGGAITSEDMQRTQAEWVQPISVDTFGRTGWTIPPNSQGYLALAATWIFEMLGSSTDLANTDFHHAAIEAYRSVAWERNDVVADPDHAPLPPDLLVSPDRLRRQLETIDMSLAGTWPRPAPAPGGTAFLCTMDASGMAVSFIQSNFHGIGSGLSAGDTGVFLQNRGAGFSLTSGHPNELRGGRRPLHTLAPTLWTRNGATDLVLGTRGGSYQPQILLQILAGLFHGRVTPEESQSAPRWIVPSFGPNDRSTVVVEHAMANDVVAGLGERGHLVERSTEATMPGWGPVSLITSDGVGHADPRVTSAAAVSG